MQHEMPLVLERRALYNRASTMGLSILDQRVLMGPRGLAFVRTGGEWALLMDRFFARVNGGRLGEVDRSRFDVLRENARAGTAVELVNVASALDEALEYTLERWEGGRLIAAEAGTGGRVFDLVPWSMMVRILRAEPVVLG